MLMDNRLELEVLPFRLALISIQKEDIEHLTHAILHSAFFSSSKKDEHFFSFTNSPHEISIILPVEHLDYFPEDLIELCPTFWKALQLYPGVDGSLLDYSKTVHLISAPLAREHISIFQVSTFSSDFTLVPEDCLTQALHCLAPHFQILPNPSYQPSEPAGPPSPVATYSPISRHPFSLPIDDSILIGGFPYDYKLSQIIYHLMQCMFFQQTSFFSFTLAYTDLSIMLTMRDYELLKAEDVQINILNALPSCKDWKMLEIGDNENGLGFDEPGIVASFTSPLATRGVQCFYLSTFQCDYVFVPACGFKEAVTLLQQLNSKNETKE